MRLTTLTFLALLAPAAVHAYTPGSSQTEPSCPKGDRPVWVNTRTSVYHYRGMRWYGHTKSGKYICEKDAQAEGDRVTRNGE
ncbi:hypothetical protein B0W47_00755 [Komagataeibacter nataicola]|uniref:Uncharacterized protein n=1 Tax=Komagataeibacter nataicola TaxID=265960 RepID=A0A9N7C5W4_9PROT|nr:hypothetical protein [Komagataeibacter nataicola]AQU86227.1 hypothetical protein B0W47_00755 [Komagataeibacter nataicola]PYD64933.1 hypothetical protein CDI09_16490 [Komagataeibacter nataicola]WNM08365.1 hypothetical protein RI056_16130 [Komagataeibacter nataicola]GBR26837.1 hypothetical protein AA0616_3306 [Komagataeibacter nataicola NRIC 0616]